MNIAQIRAKYPQYNDLSDRQLADALHSKFYSDLPIGDYYKRIGFTSGPPPVAESPLISKAKEYLPPAVVETIQQFTDIPVGFQRGVTQGIRMLSDVFGANNAVSQALRRNEETLTSLMSAQARNDQQEVSRILKEAEDKGTLDQVKAGVKAFTVAPVDTLVSALGTAAPAIVGALGAKVLGAGALIGTGVSALTGAAMGTGAVKGTIYEETKQALINAGATEQEAEKRAQLAQEYGGKNLDQILLGTAIGGVAAVGPLEKGAARMLATRISKNIAAREAAEQAGTTGLRGRAVAGVAEALPEAGQAAQEQIAANIAQQREGLEVPTFRGAVSSATMEGLAGAGLGATLGRPGTRPEPAAVTEETPIEKARREAEAAAAAAPTPEAPPVEEPIVRKPGEPKPLPETLDDATIRSIGFTRGKIRDALLGKAITDPEIRTVLEEYKQRPNASAKTAAKIDAFLARLPEAAAPPVPEPAPPAPVEAAASEPAPVAPPPVVEAPVPPTAPPVEAPVGGAPAPAPITPAPAPTPEAPSVPTATTEPTPSGAGPGVAGGPPAVTPAAGVGGAEPTGVVPPTADVGQPPGREEAAPAPVAAAPAPAPEPAPAKKVALSTYIKNLGIKAVVGDVPDYKVIRETVESRDPQIYRALMFYLGRDARGDLLVGANNLPQTPSLKEAAEMAGLGSNNAARVGNVARSLGITEAVRRKALASQTDIIVTGRAVSEAGTGASVETPKTALITKQTWYEPLANKGVDQVNDTELARAAVKADRFLENPENEPIHAAIMAEVQKRSKRPEFRSALKKEFGIASEDVDVEERAPGQEEAVDEVESEARTTTPAYPEIEDDEAKRIEDQIRGKSLVEAAEFVAKYFKVGDQKTIAQRVVDRLRRMEAAGFNFNLVLVEPGVKAPTSVAVGNANGLSHLKYEGGMPKVTVYLRSVEIGTSGINPRIMLHEFLHAATQAAIHLGNMRGAAGTSTAKFTSDLIDLQNAFIKHFNQRVNDSKAGKTSLTEMEEAILKRNVNAGLDPDELLAWGLTNPKFQQYLETIPYKARTAWTAFVDSVRSFLGLAPRMDTALSELLHVSDDILNGDPYEEIALSKRIFGAQAAQGPQAPAKTAPTEVIGERKERTLREDIGRELKGNKLLRLREKFTDSMAPVDDLFTNAYGGKVRDRMGNLNPMVLLSRALDALRISKAVQEQGGLTKVDGLWVAEERDLSYSKVLSRIAEEAKKQKKTYDKFAKELGTLLYAHREYNLREKNKTLKKEDQITLLLDDPTLDKLEADFQSNEFAQDVLKDLDTIRFDLIDKLVESGRISKETAQEWKDNTGYIPFERIGEYENAYASAKGANRGAAALKKMRALEGSKRQTVNPIENFSGLVDWMVKETIKNEASVRALDDMVLLGAAKKVPSADAVAKDAEGAVVQVYKDGAPVFYYLLDAAHLPTFSLIDRKVPNTFKLMQKGSQILRAGVTGMPPFAIKQVFDDIARAYAYAGVENNAELVKRILTNFPKNWFNEIFKRKTASAKEMERLGIVGTFDFSQTGNLQNIMEQAGAKKEGLGKAMLRVMEAGAKASDLAVRQAIYDQVKKETGDTAAAESAAREIINFSRRGSSETMNLLISVIPFFNAYARGMDKLAVAAAGKAVGKSVGVARSMFYKRMGMLTAMGLLYALAMQDDEEYQSLPDHVRDTNWVLPGGKYLGFTPVIPVPAELAFFFKAIPERVVQYMKYQGTDEERAGIDLLGNMVTRGIDVFSSPNITPQVLRPMLENYINYSFFLGRPLESQAQQALEPYMREGMGTSDTMKALAKNINDFAESTGFEALKISPIKLENLVRGMLGTGAGLALSMADAVTNPDRTDRPLHQQLTPQLTGASALMKDSVGTRMMDEIYKLDRRTEQAHNSLNRLMKNNPEEIESYMEQNKGILGIRPIVKSTMDAIRTLNEQARTIDKDKAMSPEERRKLINELRVEQNNIAKTVFSLRKQARDIQYGL